MHMQTPSEGSRDQNRARTILATLLVGIFLLGIGAMFSLVWMELEWTAAIKNYRCVLIEVRQGELSYDPAFKSWRRSSDRAIYACSNGSTHERTCNGSCPPLGSTPEMKE